MSGDPFEIGVRKIVLTKRQRLNEVRVSPSFIAFVSIELGILLISYIGQELISFILIILVFLLAVKRRFKYFSGQRE